MIEFSGGFLPSSSPAVLGPDEWLKYQCGEGHTLSGIPDSSDLFTVRCLDGDHTKTDGDHTMTHCKSVLCEDPPVVAYATPLGGCFVTITYGKQVKYQREAGYHVESERKSGSKPEGCHEKERAEPEQLVQAPEESVGAVSSCGHVDQLEVRFVSWIGQQDRPLPSHEWLGAAPDAKKWLIGQFLSRALQARVRRMSYVSSPDMSGEPSWSDIREVKGRKLMVLILKGQEVFARHRLPS